MGIDFQGNLLLSSCVDGTEVLGEFSVVPIVVEQSAVSRL